MLVALHGRGATSADILSLGYSLLRDGHHVFPDAPYPWPPDETPMGFAWYMSGPDKDAQVEDSRRRLLECLAAARRALEPGFVVLLGFSQGALMTLETGLAHTEGETRHIENGSSSAGVRVGAHGRAPLRDEHPVADALVALSGYLHREAGGPSSPPTLIVHGTADDTVPVEMGRDAHERLKRRGVPVTYRELPVDHEITPEVLAAVREFLGGVLAREVKAPARP
jgi:phospholipase/carboxylesterase